MRFRFSTLFCIRFLLSASQSTQFRMNYLIVILMDLPSEAITLTVHLYKKTKNRLHKRGLLGNFLLSEQ